MYKIIARCCYMIAFLTLAGCIAVDPPKGVVATVNGEYITLIELEKRRSSVYPFISDSLLRNKRALQDQYVYVLTTLIEEKLIEQFLRSKKITVAEEIVIERLEQLRGDFSEENMRQLLAEEGSSYDEWKAKVHRQLLIEAFYTQVLRPTVSISSVEVKEYYDSHRQDFIIPEEWRFLQITGLDDGIVDAAKKLYLATGNISLVQLEYPVTVRNIRMGKDRLPEDMIKEFEVLSVREASKIHKVGNTESYVYIMLEKIPPRPLNVVEIYERLQQILIEKKLYAAYETWMTKRMEKSKISIHQKLLEEIVEETIEAQPAETIEDVPLEDVETEALEETN